MRILLIFIVALIICVLYVIFHQFLLQIPAKEEWQYNLGMLFQGLSLSYIAAFLFYIVHNYYPYLKARKKYQSVIDRELSDLWEICNDFIHMIGHYSKISAYDSFPYDFKNAVPRQLQNLPVNLNNREDDHSTDSGISNSQKNHTIPADEEFDEKTKALRIRELEFDKWSETIEYVNSNINNTLNKTLKLKDLIEEETILKIFDLEKSSNDFRIVARIYEESNKKTFENGYLEKQFIKFYEATQELRKYNKAYKDPTKNQG
jgi:hypothetical protein